jgi:exonuclease III
MNSDLQVASWNVRGLGDPHRAQIVTTWLRWFYSTTDVVCLQELQAKPAIVEIHLRNLIQNGTVIFDVNAEGQIGSAIVVKPDLEVLDKGKKGDGTFAWIKIQSSSGPIYIGSVYAPAERGKRIRFWR